jgi:hypothetical protein
MAKLHTQRQNIYHTCARCGTDQPLARMKWQNGILICSTLRCIDTAIIGSRDINVAREIGIDRHELVPDVKLTTPVIRTDDQYEVLW